MNCPICAMEMVKAQATSFGDFYMYCRGCKKEMAELLKVTVKEESVAVYRDLPSGFWQEPEDWNAIARQVGMDLAKKTKRTPPRVPPDFELL